MLALDLREMLRSLRRDRLYTAVVVGTLALAIGAATAVFAIVNGVLLRPLDYPDPARLVVVHEVVREMSGQYPTLPANPRHFERWRERAAAFDAMAAFRDTQAHLTGLGEAAQIPIVRTSGTLFDVLQVRPSLGRLLERDDERLDRPPAAVVSHGMWRTRMGADPAAVGRSITLDGVPHAVVGVLAAGARFPRFEQLNGSADLSSAAEVFVPIRLDLTKISPVGEFNYHVVGRLRPAAAPDAAQAELDVLQAAIAREAADEGHPEFGLRALVRPLDETIVGSARRPLLLLLAAVVAVLVVAASNLASLSLARTLARLRDGAIRTALGATGWRLVGRVVLEHTALAAAGGALAVGVAVVALRLFVTTAPLDLPRAGEVAIDLRALAFAALASLATALAVALAPAWRTARRDPHDALRGGGNAIAGGGGRARSLLVTVQIALAVALLAVTALLGVSFARLLGDDRGFSTDRVLAVDLSVPVARYGDPARITAVYDRVLERVAALPGVSAAALASVLPLTGENWVDAVRAEDDARPLSELPLANYRFVSADYFRVLGMPMLRGRSFTQGERDGPTVPAIVSVRTAAIAWPGVDPIGRRFLRGDPKQTPFEVVGVVADGRSTRLDAAPPLMVYVPHWFRSRPSASVVVAGALDTATAAAVVRGAVADVDAEIAIARVRPLQQLVDDAIAPRRYLVYLFTVFGGAGLLIAATGVYAIAAYTASQRRREMNIRMALGATPGRVLWLIVREAAAPLAVGIVVGVAAALAGGAVAAGLLFEVGARDPRVIGAVAAGVAAVGLAATIGAARRILDLEPAAVLREG